MRSSTPPPLIARPLNTPSPHFGRFFHRFQPLLSPIPREPRWAELASEFLVEMQGVFGLTQPSMLEIVLQVGLRRAFNSPLPYPTLPYPAPRSYITRRQCISSLLEFRS